MTTPHDDVSAAALAAACAAATGLGLTVEAPRVISDRGNLLVHIAPEPVVVRVATHTAWTRRDPAAWLAREVAVARHVADKGGPVVVPSSVVDPGPHHEAGFALTLWQFVPTSARRAGPKDAGRELAVFHAMAHDAPVELPSLVGARDQIEDTLFALERDAVLPPEQLDGLRARHAEVLADLDGAGSAPVVLHGDAHAGNLLDTPIAWRWTDLEETCSGPPEWDLAVLVEGFARNGDGGGPRGAAALQAYADESGRPVPTAEELAPFRRARELEALVWLQAMAHLYPQRYAEKAAEGMASLHG